MLGEATCILLAGGAGTRVRPLYPNCPKVLIPVAGRPFLDWVLRYWAQQGVRRVILSLGYLGDQVERFLGENSYPGLQIEAVREAQPLGTGGAIAWIARLPSCTDPFIAANADSLAVSDLSPMAALLADPEVDGVLAGIRVADAGRFGTLRIAADGTLLSFEEKRPGEGWINGGVYFLRKRLLGLFPDRMPLSVEQEVFPALVAAGARLRVCRLEGDFLDIGTPEALRQADGFLQRNLHKLVGATVSS